MSRRKVPYGYAYVKLDGGFLVDKKTGRVYSIHKTKKIVPKYVIRQKVGKEVRKKIMETQEKEILLLRETEMRISPKKLKKLL